MKTSASSLALGVASDCVSLCAGEDGQPLEWIKLMPMGRFGGVDGRGGWEVVNLAHAQEIVAASRPREESRLPVVDYDHQTDLAAVKGVGGTAPAAGWIEEMQARDDGIWGRIAWTEKASAAISAKPPEYRYFSPVFPHSTATGRVRAILRGALTNKPNLELGALASESDHPNGDDDLDKTKLAQALGLGEGATEEQIHEAITGLKASGAGFVAVAEAAGLKADAKPAEVVTALQASSDAGDRDEIIVAMQAEINDLKAERAAEKAEGKVDAAIAEGKITPAARETFIALCSESPERFDALMKVQPQIVKPGAKPAPAGAPAGSADQLSAEEVAVCASMGWSEADYLTWKKDQA